MFRYRTDFLVGVLLTVATAVAYWPLWQNGLIDHKTDVYSFVNYDDGDYVFLNVHVHTGLTPVNVRWAFTTTHASNWHPLTWLSLQLDAQLYGLKPWGYHLTNLLLHLANVLLLYVVLRTMTGAAWPSGLAAALFAVHPLHVESVAWVTERKDVLSTCFGLLSLLAYRFYVGRPNLLRYLPVVLAFGLSLLAKPMLVTLPFVLLLLDYWPLGRLRPGGEILADMKSRPTPPAAGPVSVRWLIAEKTPLLVLAAASCLVTVYAQRAGHALQNLEHFPLETRATNAVVAYAVYLGKTLWPVHLAVFYPHPRQALPAWQVLGAVLLLAGITLLAVRTARRWPYLLVGWLWFLGTLVPVIGLVQVGAQALADRYMYVPLIGLFVAIAWALADVLRYRWELRGVLFLLVGLVLAGCGVLTLVQLRSWRNSVTLWEHALQVTDDNYVAHNNLGVLLALDPRQANRALEQFDKAIQIKPDFVAALVNRAAELRKRGRLKEAEQDAREALKAQPEDAAAHNTLAVLLATQGEFAAAEREFQTALRLDPENAQAHVNFGMLLEHRGRYQEAADHYAEAARLRPGEPAFQRQVRPPPRQRPAPSSSDPSKP